MLISGVYEDWMKMGFGGNRKAEWVGMGTLMTQKTGKRHVFFDEEAVSKGQLLFYLKIFYC
jgi:hypothetical protein